MHNKNSLKEKCLEIKAVIVGESNVGKSSLLIKFVHNHFRNSSIPATIGASYLTKTIKNETNLLLKFNIWDTAGQEKYRSLASLYYRGADCAIIVYDITNRNSFEQVQLFWINELKHQCNENDDGLIIIIVGNKSDLTEERKVSIEEGKQLAYLNNALFYETSAKNDRIIDNIFQSLANNDHMIRNITYNYEDTNNNEKVYKLVIPTKRRNNNICCR